MYQASSRTPITEDHEVLLICGIARTNYLLDYLHSRAGAVKLMQFEDHHVYSRHDLEMMKKYYDNMVGQKRMILTTEKDAMRLEAYRDFLSENDMHIDILPIVVEFLFDEGPLFDEWVKQFLLNFKV
jgi:tetraacyldisaccharide 4'-kinase